MFTWGFFFEKAMLGTMEKYWMNFFGGFASKEIGPPKGVWIERFT